MTSTQDHLPIVDVKEDVGLLRNGDMAIILETSAVNFGLLSANEQYAIISAFAGLLNSLSFTIQIVIRSKRLDISDYLKLLDESHKTQVNPLLANMMVRYRSFIERTVRENEVLDKQFYIVISVSYLEIGITKSISEETFKKALTILYPRRDHIIRQLSRIGLKATQLNHDQIVRLIYDIYNFDPRNPVQNQLKMGQKLAVSMPLVPPQKNAEAVVQPSSPPAPTAPVKLRDEPQTAVATPPPLQVQAASPLPNAAPFPRRASPFVVEELADDYSSP